MIKIRLITLILAVLMLSKIYSQDTLIVSIPLDKPTPFRLKVDNYTLDIYNPEQTDYNYKIFDGLIRAEEEIWKLYDERKELKRRIDNLTVNYNKKIFLLEKELDLMRMNSKDLNKKLKHTEHKLKLNKPTLSDKIRKIISNITLICLSYIFGIITTIIV